MISISITDVTIKQSGKNAGYTLSFREKIEIAKLLDKLGVNVIELHGIENEKVDSLLIKSIGSAVKDSTVAVSVALDDSSVKKTWNGQHPPPWPPGGFLPRLWSDPGKSTAPML